MATLRPKPVLLQAHKLRFGDVHGYEDELPEWLYEAIETGAVTLHPPENVARLGASGAVVRVGEWLVQPPTGSLLVLTDQDIAYHYEVLP